MINIFLALAPFFFFKELKGDWVMVMWLFNAFAQGFIYASRKSFREMMESEIKKLRKEVDE